MMMILSSPPQKSDLKNVHYHWIKISANRAKVICRVCTCWPISYDDQSDCTKKYAENHDWGLCNFNDWQKARQTHCPDEKWQSDLFNSPPWDVAQLNHWLCLYITEARWTDGKKYHVTTVYQLLSGILHHMRSVDPDVQTSLTKPTTNSKTCMLLLTTYVGRQLCTKGVRAEVNMPESFPLRKKMHCGLKVF